MCVCLTMEVVCTKNWLLESKGAKIGPKFKYLPTNKAKSDSKLLEHS